MKNPTWYKYDGPGIQYKYLYSYETSTVQYSTVRLLACLKFQYTLCVYTVHMLYSVQYVVRFGDSGIDSLTAPLCVRTKIAGDIVPGS